ncbi:MAG: GTP cyclohydrolase II [Alphaproteobacteria bacterium]|nr:GTP cyclohydrolase II [Alphaproteobacteria bacterium]
MSDLPALSPALRRARARNDLRLGLPVCLKAPEGWWMAVSADVPDQGFAPGSAVLASGGEPWPQGAPQPVARAGLALAKQAGLLPKVRLWSVGKEEAGGVTLEVEEALASRRVTAEELDMVGEAALPLEGAPASRVRVYRERYAPEEHLALLIGTPGEVPLTRVHSSCLTGDVLGSLRCDCGSQLGRAIRQMVEAGGGVLLYVSQEGRGIGIANKIRAYALQDEGKDTVEANLHLGFEVDERDYSVASAMLSQLGISRVRLLSNNPAKQAALEALGVTVVERVKLPGTVTEFNAGYLKAKAEKCGHG